MPKVWCSIASAACLVLGALGPGAAGAQSSAEGDTEVRVNYVYAAQLGIGTYNVGGLSVDVFSLPLSTTVPLEETFDLELPVEHGADWLVRFKYPVSLGIFDFEQNDPDFGQIDIKQYTLALVPGVELVAPVTENWRLKPFASLGLGKVVASSGTGASDNDFFAIYTAGLRSVVDIPLGDYGLSIGNGVLFAGNADFGDAFSENYWAIETGGQVRRSLGFDLGDLGVADSDLAAVEPEAGLYFIHYYFPEPLKFSRFREDPLEVRNQFEFGLTLGSATPWEFLSIPDPQIGASYIFGDGLEVFRVNFGFPL